MDIGSAVGRKEGLTERQLMELADFEHSDAFNELEKAVLRFATHLTVTPAEVPDEVFDALRPHFTPRQLFDIMGWAPNSRSYDRLREVLRRLKALVIRYENSWWDITGRACIRSSSRPCSASRWRWDRIGT